MSYLYILKDGEPVLCLDTAEWGRWMESCDDGRRVGDTQVGPYRISTVFLGMDHGWDEGPPVLWESMVFDSDGEDQYQERYTSREAALAGHDALVELYSREEEG